MKKVFAFALVLAMVLSMAVPAFAVSSPGASEEDLTPTPAEKTDGKLIITNTENIEDLPEEAQEIFQESKEVLEEVTAKDNLSVNNLFYATLEGDLEQSDAEFEVEDYREPVVMQYVDGEWVELEVVINPDRSITVKGIVEGPIAFMVPQLPFLISSSNDEIIVISEEKIKDLPREAREAYSEAKKNLADAVPEGMLVRHMFHVDNAHIADDASAVFDIGDFHGLLVKQFVDAVWHVREFTENDDNTITVHGLRNGPMAFFVN